MGQTNTIDRYWTGNIKTALEVSSQGIWYDYDRLRSDLIPRLVCDREPCQLTPLVCVEDKCFNSDIRGSADRELRDTFCHFHDPIPVFVEQSHIFNLNRLSCRRIANIRNDKRYRLICFNSSIFEKSKFCDHSTCGDLYHFSTRCKWFVHAYLGLWAGDRLKVLRRERANYGVGQFQLRWHYHLQVAAWLQILGRLECEAELGRDTSCQPEGLHQKLYEVWQSLHPNLHSCRYCGSWSTWMWHDYGKGAWGVEGLWVSQLITDYN